MQVCAVTGLRVALVVFILAVLSAAAKAGLVVDHSANRLAGSTSDTAVITPIPESLWWQQIADDISLDTSAVIQHIAWWGFYYSDVIPSTETMRIRFYDARAVDGLPGNVIFEELVNASGVATGVMVSELVAPVPEYRFEADLPRTILLHAETRYWLEIVQLGSEESFFGWRGAGVQNNGTAIRNPTYGNWIARGDLDSAFQLFMVPEPGTLGLIVLGASLAERRPRMY